MMDSLAGYNSLGSHFLSVPKYLITCPLGILRNCSSRKFAFLCYLAFMLNILLSIKSLPLFCPFDNFTIIYHSEVSGVWMFPVLRCLSFHQDLENVLLLFYWMGFLCPQPVTLLQAPASQIFDLLRVPPNLSHGPLFFFLSICY